jgi:hypothetical protein
MSTLKEIADFSKVLIARVMSTLMSTLERDEHLGEERWALLVAGFRRQTGNR